MNSSTESNPITGPGILWAQQQILAHFDKVAPKLPGAKMEDVVLTREEEVRIKEECLSEE